MERWNLFSKISIIKKCVIGDGKRGLFSKITRKHAEVWER
jgi:hypothetical protein